VDQAEVANCLLHKAPAPQHNSKRR
jgi:hypothetical protein